MDKEPSGHKKKKTSVNKCRRYTKYFEETNVQKLISLSNYKSDSRILV